MTGTPWWATLLTALAGGAIALAGSLANGVFDRRRSRREEWFRRIRWAQQLTASDRARDQKAGYRLLESLANSNLAVADDLQLLYSLSGDTRLAARSGPADFAVEHTETTSARTEEEGT